MGFFRKPLNRREQSVYNKAFKTEHAKLHREQLQAANAKLKARAQVDAHRAALAARPTSQKILGGLQALKKGIDKVDNQKLEAWILDKKKKT
jgi:hypothetical protein